MNKTKLVVAKLIMFDVAMDTLRAIARDKRRRKWLLAQSAVDFIETQLEQHGRKLKRYSSSSNDASDKP